MAEKNMTLQLDLIGRINRIVETNSKNGVGLKDILIREGEPISGNTPLGMKYMIGSRNNSERRINNEDETDQYENENRRRKYKTGEIDYFEPWGKDEMKILFDSIDKNWEKNITEKAIDRPLATNIGRMRVNLFTYNGEYSVENEIGINGKLGACIRVFPDISVKLQDLNIPASAIEAITSKNGMILLTGGTGVGKSTTASAFLQYLNETRSGHIITIENPIEMIIKEDKCRISQREVPSNIKVMAQGVQDSMRQFPEALLIGEIRDWDSADAAMFAGESGHIVVGTVHSNSAIGCLSKMLSFFHGSETTRAESLSQCLLAVIAQILVPSVDNKTWIPIYETIALTDQNIKDMIALRKWGELQKILKEGTNNSLICMNQSLLKAVKEKLISSEMAIKYSTDKSDLKKLLSE